MSDCEPWPSASFALPARHRSSVSLTKERPRTCQCAREATTFFNDKRTRWLDHCSPNDALGQGSQFGILAISVSAPFAELFRPTGQGSLRALRIRVFARPLDASRGPQSCLLLLISALQLLKPWAFYEDDMSRRLAAPAAKLSVPGLSPLTRRGG